LKAYLAVTDQEWFDFLSRRPDLDEVNFWTPNPWGGEFRVVNRGELLLFKLKNPYNAIAGGGFFEHYTELRVSMAWSAFGEKNGAATLAATRARISLLRHETPKPWDDYTIGCIILVDPFFWNQADWIPQPSDFRSQIVRGKTYDMTAGAGRELWDRVVERLVREGTGRLGIGVAEPKIPGGYGEPILRPRRIGQGTFRVVITDLYGRRCAVTEEKALPTLDAVHVRPFSEEPENYVRNGILMRSDLHRLFDAGYMTITPEYRAEVSGRIKEDFDDGESYMKLHGNRVWVPERLDFRPDPEVLAWHNESVYRG
jgi:putative restriction endonuclease